MGESPYKEKSTWHADLNLNAITLVLI